MLQNNNYKNFVDRYIYTKFSDLNKETIDSGKKILIDSIACALSGFNHPFYLKIQKIAKLTEINKHSIWGTNNYSNRSQAVFLNAICMSVMDYEDTDDGVPMHISSILLPILLSECERNKSIIKYEDFITSFCVGIESAIRLGRSGNIKGTKGWNWGAICASYGSIIAIANLLRWSQERTLCCLGHLLLQQGGSLQAVYELKESMRLQAGYAAIYCSNAIDLTEENIESVTEVFTGRAGLFQIYQFGDFDIGPISDFSSPFQYTENLSLKNYPCCRFIHAAIDCAIDAYHQGIKIEDIQYIEVFATKQTINMVGKKISEKINLFESQFNLRKLLTLALYHGNLSPEILINQCSQNEMITNFSREKINVNFNDEKLGLLPFHFTVFLKNGVKKDFSCKSISGSKNNPLSEKDIKTKFTSCFDVARPFKNSQHAYSELISLEHSDNISIISEILS